MAAFDVSAGGRLWVFGDTRRSRSKDSGATTVHVDAHRMYVIEGVLALRAKQRMLVPEIPAVEKTARVELGHQLLL